MIQGGRVLVAALLVLSSCGGGSGPSPTPSLPEEDRFLAAVDGLCGALGSAQEPAASEAAFLDRAHDVLHEIADRVQAVDREIAADLLQAKARVEAEYEGGDPSPSRLELALTDLIRATRDALSALGVESPGCG